MIGASHWGTVGSLWMGVAVVVLGCGGMEGASLHVPGDYATIQAAIDASSDGDRVIVAEGVYYENINFKGKNIIVTSSGPRDPRVAASTIIDGRQLDSVVTFAGTENATCVLAGFTIRNGYADFGIGEGGGGICGGSENNHTHATIRYNTIVYNHAWDGGGISRCDGLIARNIIAGNTSRWWQGGGGLYECNGVIRNNVIVGNEAGGCDGAGALSFCDAVIENCTIAYNIASLAFGPIDNCNGPIRNCIIWANEPSWHLPAVSFTSIGVDPLFASPGYWETDALGRPSFFVLGDYHLKSQGGRYDPVGGLWVYDDVTSRCIDAGDPRSAVMHEPFPNGGVINMGAYGGTAEASKSFGGAFVYVDDDAPLYGDGKTWATAFRFLQDALENARAGAEIRVAGGVYRPDQSVMHTGSSSRDRAASFVLKDGTVIRGGFAGFGAADPDERDIKRYETILSGDLAGNDTGLTAENAFDNPTRGDNCYHVLTARGLAGTVVLEGLTVTGGYSDRTAPAAYGAGLWTSSIDHIQRGLIRIVQCRFSGNAGYGGGAIDASQTDLEISQSIFTNNFAEACGGAFKFSYNSVNVENSIFTGNAAGFAGGAIDGFNHRLTLQQCVFVENEGGDLGGAIASSHYCSLNLSGCILWRNSAEEGSQIWTGEGVWGAVSYCNVDELNADGIACWDDEFYSGPGNIDADPLFADASAGDYRLKSQAGRWDAAKKAWVQDDVTSPCIDAGDPRDAIMHETFPNGGVVNMGAYGGTAEASKSWFGGPVCERIVAGDINGDCAVDLADLAILAVHWLAGR